MDQQVAVPRARRQRRREYLGLAQSDLAKYGGPAVSTVGKIERAAQENFPPRTLQQLDMALGWTRGTSSDLLREFDDEAGWAKSETWREAFEADLIEREPPDLTQLRNDAAHGLIQNIQGIEFAFVGDLDDLEAQLTEARHALDMATQRLQEVQARARESVVEERMVMELRDHLVAQTAALAAIINERREQAGNAVAHVPSDQGKPDE